MFMDIYTYIIIIYSTCFVIYKYITYIQGDQNFTLKLKNMIKTTSIIYNNKT